MLVAERALAKAQGRQYAEVIDIGVEWETGAPMPLLVSNGLRASVMFHSRVAETANQRGVIEFHLVSSIRMGAPNDEAISGHPLHGNGLRAYSAHEVYNSEWLQEHIRMNSVHPRHSDEVWRRNHHYLLAFHDEMVECLAEEVRSWVTDAPFATAFSKLVEGVLGES